MKELNTFQNVMKLFCRALENEIRKKRALDAEEVNQLMKIRSKLALLCPETGGLQPKHRLKCTVDGNTREERIRSLREFAYRQFWGKCESDKDFISQSKARLFSRVVRVEGFTDGEVYHILSNERFKKRKDR